MAQKAEKAEKDVADVIVSAIDDYMVGIFDADAQELAERLKLHVLEALAREQGSRTVQSVVVPGEVQLAYLRLAQTAVSVAGHKVQQKPVDEVGQAAAIADAKTVSTWFSTLPIQKDGI
jgi:hypothetical protein